MTDPAAARSFLRAEVEGLEPFDFVAVGRAGKPLHVVEVTRREDGGLEVRVPGRPPIVSELPVPVRSALRERGFTSEDAADPTKPWVHPVVDAEAAAALVQRVLVEVFDEKPDVPLDVAHGSHRAEYEAQRKLAGVRQRIEAILTESFGRRPEQDEDGDYLLPVKDVRVVVAPRVAAGGPAVVRVFAVTNVGVSVTPELALFLARLNFGLIVGRFTLDVDHRVILFDEKLIGEGFTDEDVRFTIDLVGSTADHWDDRLKQMFGGATYQEVLTSRTGASAPTAKPGQGGYLLPAKA
jgi:hypothetical protein